MATVITAKNLQKCYPGFPPVLRDVNIDVQAGEMVAIMGPSGCGKSTMLHILGLLHKPDSGTLDILNEDIIALDRDGTSAFRRDNMGFVMQSSNLFEHSTVFENVEFPLIYDRVPPEERWERVIRALELVRLSHRVSYRSNRLSGGEQQRVAIARAMVNNPRILLADEPTGALDARTSKVIMQNFRSLAHDGGIAMVIVTHDPSVSEYCDTVYTLEEGMLVCQRKTPVPAPSGNSQILKSAPRLINNVCVVDEFPTLYGTADTQTILNMYDQHVLSRVYSMRGTSLASIGEGEYSLPVPIKKQGILRSIGNIFSLMRTNHGNPGIVWKYWSYIPKSQRINIFAAARHFWHIAKSFGMVRWGIADETKHLHAIGSPKVSTAAWVASGVIGIPFSFSLHTKDTKNLSLTAVKAKFAAFVRCDTRETQEKLKQACLALDANFPTDKILTIYDSPALYPSADDLEAIGLAARHGEINIVMAGHVTARKGIMTCLKACSVLKKAGVPFKLQVLGGGASIALLRLRTIAMGLRKYVKFIKYVPHEQVADYLTKAHIFVAAGNALHSRYDGISISLMEAMVYGLPIVASDLPGHMEVLEHEKNALIFQQNDAQSIVNAINRLATQPDEAHALGKAAQKTAQELFSQEKQGKQLAEAILKYSPKH